VFATRRKGSLVGLDITTSSVKLIELVSSGRGYRVESYAAEATPPNAINEKAIVDAEAAGKPALGLAHLPDYLDAIACGRIDAHADPLITSRSAFSSFRARRRNSSRCTGLTCVSSIRLVLGTPVQMKIAGSRVVGIPFHG